MTTRPEPSSEQFIKRVHAALQPVLAEFGEPAAAVVCIPWVVGQESCPFGAVVLPEEAKGRLSSKLILDSLDQLRKMSGYLHGLLIKSAAEAARQLETDRKPSNDGKTGDRSG